jgi:hypothetical protein
VDPVPDPLLLRKSGSAGNRTWDLWICGQELRPLDHKGDHLKITNNFHLKLIFNEINKANFKQFPHSHDVEPHRNPRVTYPFSYYRWINNTSLSLKPLVFYKYIPSLYSYLCIKPSLFFLFMTFRKLPSALSTSPQGITRQNIKNIKKITTQDKGKNTVFKNISWVVLGTLVLYLRLCR